MSEEKTITSVPDYINAISGLELHGLSPLSAAQITKIALAQNGAPQEAIDSLDAQIANLRAEDCAKGPDLEPAA